MSIAAAPGADPADGFEDELGSEIPEDVAERRVDWGMGTRIATLVWTALGLAAAFTLSVDKVKILIDPTFSPSCNFNPVLSCGSVMVTEQASAFGFPNPFLGLIGFSVMLTLAVLLIAQVRLPRLIWAGAALGSLLGLVFVHWLIFQSLYRIGALCPWCMVVWAVTAAIFVWFTAKALDECGLPRAARALWTWRFTIIVLWYLAVAVLILIRFWDYWSSLV